MYQDRCQAGEALAAELADRGYGSVSLFAVPRGGVIVAAPVAERLGVRIDILVTRKIGHPANPEVAIGAVMADGTAVLDEEIIRAYAVPTEYLDRAIAREFAEIERRMIAYTGSAATPDITGRTAVIVDDGIATGYTIRAAIAWLKTLRPSGIVVAVPVAPPETVAAIADVDEVICPLQPAAFMAVGQHYREFPQNSDQEVQSILNRFNTKR
ncbi:phosphoribosyltransferase [Anaeroselena agilis]|uniref:Phosphoribosyltransferase family protein n=1 Tax=Anaeroselena agilis TaxID=3063788 RepID=A0ABU3P2M4_9FIRM|nr:phosphoribosyltransferase family protein [Selenomonadales bacterium 4137-cl]